MLQQAPRKLFAGLPNACIEALLQRGVHGAILRCRGAGSTRRSFADEAGGGPTDKDKVSDTSAAGEETEDVVDETRAPDPVDVDDLQTLLMEQDADLKEAKAQLQEVKDLNLRLMADMENLRVRKEQQMQEMRQFAVQDFAKGILDVADNLERALHSVPPEMLEAGPSSDNEALSKTLQVMLKIFKENGLEPIPAELGGEFDPNLHNAMFEIPTDEYAPGVIATTVKTGYRLHERVIRAADVGVAKSAL